MKHNFIDLTGKTFGSLKVIGISGRENGNITWICKCDCGNETIAIGRNLLRGHKLSCGCMRGTNGSKKKRDDRKYLLGIISEEEYSKIQIAWLSMKRRCTEKYHDHKDYFDRGIKVCKEWEDFIKFAEWSINNGFSIGLTLDRIDVNGNYDPNNCRWVGWKIQQNNKRNNRYITFNGETKTLKQWSEFFGIPYGRLKSRVQKGMTDPVLLFADKMI